MTNAFDIAANSYDHTFTNTIIGRKQRNRVWNYLDKVLDSNKALNILELNCGTGEDAVFFAKKGYNVLATDYSKEMLLQTQKKATNQQFKIQTQQLDLTNPHLEENKKYDLIFSNFGGLNCISKKELENLEVFLSDTLAPNGQCIFVIMPTKTIIEKWYRSYKKESYIFEKRDSDTPIKINVEGKMIATYFHSIEDLQYTFKHFKLINTIPIGFIPSYLENNIILPLLRVFDSFAYFLKLNSNKADHYLIHFHK